MPRSDLRQSRYAYLRSLGFSPTEARRLRDRSAGNIEGSVTEKETTIRAIPQRRRTQQQRTDLRAIREARTFRRAEPATARGGIETRIERQRNFNRWSGMKRFPRNIQRWISKTNRDEGLEPLDDFGYRMFYHRYVNQFRKPEAREIVESTLS
jgi:hypothetical protein